MLKSLVDSQIPGNFILILDSEDDKGEDLFVSFLKSHIENPTFKDIHLVCYEQTPKFYIRNLTNSEQITAHNHFADPVSWNDPSSTKSDLSSFLCNSTNFTESIIFIDSLTFLTKYFGYVNTYKQLSSLKKLTKKIICLAHYDLLKETQLEELKLLSSAVIKLNKSDENKDRTLGLYYRKPGGKVINQEEIFVIKPNFEVSSVQKSDNKPSKVMPEIDDEMESLTTFNLGVKLSENERKAKSKLVLPYLRSDNEAGRGEIFYEQEADDDLEDDPDDDLDI